jgi:hypothetical protein
LAGFAADLAKAFAATAGFTVSTAVGVLLTALVFGAFDFVFFVVFIISSIH